MSKLQAWLGCARAPRAPARPGDQRGRVRAAGRQRIWRPNRCLSVLAIGCAPVHRGLTAWRSMVQAARGGAGCSCHRFACVCVEVAKTSCQRRSGPPSRGLVAWVPPSRPTAAAAGWQAGSMPASGGRGVRRLLHAAAACLPRCWHRPASTRATPATGGCHDRVGLACMGCIAPNAARPSAAAVPDAHASSAAAALAMRAAIAAPNLVPMARNSECTTHRMARQPSTRLHKGRQPSILPLHREKWPAASPA